MSAIEEELLFFIDTFGEIEEEEDGDKYYVKNENCLGS
jgi:hypothetical protein